MASLHSLSISHVSFLAVISLIFIYCYTWIRSLCSNIITAKSIGFKYIVLPFHPLGTPWIVLQDLIIPLLHLLPHSWTERWYA